MPDVVASLTGGPSAFWSVMKRYWLFAVVGVLALIAILVRYRNDIAQKFNGMPASVKTWLKVTGFLAPVGYALLSVGDAMAAVAGRAVNACAGGLPCGAGSGHGPWAWIVGVLLTAAGSLAVGMFFAAEDTLDLEDSQNGRSIAYTPAATAQDRSLFLNVHRAFDDRGRPLIATAITIKVVCMVANTNTAGNSIYHDDLDRLVESVSIESPRLGTLLDKVTGAGPVLGRLVSFLGSGFNSNGDMGIKAMPPGTGNTTVTKYFTFPLATGFLRNPLMTGQYLKALDKTEIKVRLAPTTALAAVNASAATIAASSTLSGVVSYVALPGNAWFRPRMSYFRLDTPASGSDGFVFRNFGDKGPRASVPLDNVTTLAQLSNLKGLPGNTAIDNIIRILAPQIGVDDVTGMDLFVQQRIKSQRLGNTGRPNYLNGGNGNYAMGVVADGGGMALSGLLALYLMQPSVHADSGAVRVQAAGSEIRIREEFTTPRTGSDAFLIHSIREMNDGDVRAMSALYAGKIPLVHQAAPRRAGVPPTRRA